MSKNRKRSVVENKITEEVIKSVMELYAPNKVQRFFMKYFGYLWSPSNTKRVKQISDILNMTTKEVLALEKKYYNL